MRNRILGIATALVCACTPLMLAPSCTITFVTPESATSTETQNVTLPADAAVVISNELGATTVNVDESAAEATIRIVRVAYAGTEQEAQDLLAEMQVDVVEPTAQDNRLLITAAAVPGATTNRGNFSMVVSDDDVAITSILSNARVAKYRLTITLPPGHAVQATQQSGVVRATGLDTESSLTGSAASIRASDCVAKVTIQTDAGSVDVTSHSGSLAVTTSAGSAVVDIADVQADDEVNVHADAGSVVARLPVDVAANLEASSGVGAVYFDESDFTDATVTTDTFAHVVATLNGGGAAVTLQTDVGSITVQAR